MAAFNKTFLDEDGLKALWLKLKSILPFRSTSGTAGTAGWVKVIDLTCGRQMNKPLVFHLICRGYSTSTVEVTFLSQTDGTTPDVHYFIHAIKSSDGTSGANSNVGYTYEDIDGVRHYYFWKKKNGGYGTINIHVDCQSDWIKLISFPNEQSNTEPTGIVYATQIWDTVPMKTAVAASARQVGYDKYGQVVLGNALTPSDLGISATTTSVTVGSTTANIPQATTTTPKMDGTAAVGTETKWAKGDHVHPTDTSRAPTSHASSTSTYGIGTTANYGHVKLATGDMNGATHADGVAVSKNHTHSQYVPTTRTVNGHALSADVTVTAADVSAVRYDTASQGLTDTQKSNARTNIGAGTSNLTIGTTSTTAAAGNHTHTTSIASDSSSGTIVTLAHNTQYKLTAGGTSVLFKTPADNNTDTKVTQNKDDSGTTAYPLLMAGAADPNGTATAARYDSDVTLTPSTNTISANISGNAATATSSDKLTTARELAVGLSNTSTTTTFDGSTSVTNIKVSGTLPVANGGTGSTTAADARTNLSVYSKSEVDSIMSGRIEVVSELPVTGQSGIIYYVGPTGAGADKYDEYIWTGSAFIKVGEHSLDLSNYVNTVTISGSGSVVTGVSKSGNTVTVTKGTISLDDLSDWAAETDVTISNVTYHTMWPVAPTSSNQVYGISINNGRLFRIYNNKGTYSVQAYDKDSDTTYTPQKLGIGYGTCTTAEATAAKVVTLTDYVLVKNGIVAVKFSYPLCASATLNINDKGAKPVYIGGATITSTNCKSVQAGDTGYFSYDGTAYNFLGTDRAGKSSITGLVVNGKTVTYTRADGETGTFDTQDTTYVFADSYNASTNKGATVATVTNAISALDVTDISGFGAGKTLATLKEENGKISATFQDISITKSQVSDFSHTHGNIQNGGTLQTNDITIANGDKLVVTDSSDSSKVARASISFDGSTTTTALTPKGTFEAFAKSGDITSAIQALDVSSVGGDGKYISAISETDGKISATATTMDTTPTATSTKAVTSGGVKTALDGKVSKSGDTMSGRLTLEKPLSQVLIGTGTAASSSGGTYYPAKWQFDLGVATPTAGDQMVIKLPVAGSDYGIYISTDNGTTYFPVACNTGTSRLTTRYPNGAYVCVVFEAYVSGSSGSGQVNDIFPVAGGTARTNLTTGCWRVVNDYDSGNTICQLRTENGRFYAGSTGCNPYSLVCLDKDGKYSMLISSGSGTGTSKTINTAGKFKLSPVILYYSANNTAAANALVSNTYATFIAHQSIDTRYSHNYTTTFTANSPLYIECTIDADGYWSPTAKCITQTLTSGYYYIYLGQTYSTAYQVSMSPAHPVYYYDGSNLTEVPRLAKADRTKLDGIASGATKVETSATNGKIKINGTDTTVYTHPAQTAYSAKGSATKVPKITTDSTGHVTSIEEVTISGVTPTSHDHGNIHNDGSIVGGNDGSGKPIANGDRLIVADGSNGYKAVLTTIPFDGSTTSKALTPKGTFESFAKAGDITTAIQALDVSSVGGDGTYISAISETDGKISATATTMDTSPTANSPYAVTSGGVKTALDGKQDAMFIKFAFDSSLHYADVTTALYAGKIPYLLDGRTMFVCDGSAYQVEVSGSSTTEYRFVAAVGNTSSPKIVYRYVRADNSKGINSISLALYSNISSLTTSINTLSSNIETHNKYFHTEVLHVTNEITRFLKISFSGRVGRASAIVLIGANNGNDSSAFRLSWFYDPESSQDMGNFGRELFSVGDITKKPLVYYDSNNFYIGLSDSGKWGATISVMLACENPQNVSYSTVTRAEATGGGKTNLPLEWFAVYSKTISTIIKDTVIGNDLNAMYII